MYLSRLTLDHRSTFGSDAITNAHNMHRNICGVFGSDRQSQNLLYSVNDKKRNVIIYVQSDIKPDPTRLSAHGFSPECDSLDLAEQMRSLEEGGTYQFILRAMPSKAVPIEGRRHSSRYFLSEPTDQLNWLRRKATAAGFEFHEEDIRISPCERLPVKKSGHVSFYYMNVCFTGFLTITNLELFKQARRSGFGAGRAYGLGLMLLF